jgi:hypothetical protein
VMASAGVLSRWTKVCLRGYILNFCFWQTLQFF